MEIAARDQDHTVSQHLFIHIQITITSNLVDPEIEIVIIVTNQDT